MRWPARSTMITEARKHVPWLPANAPARHGAHARRFRTGSMQIKRNLCRRGCAAQTHYACTSFLILSHPRATRHGHDTGPHTSQHRLVRNHFSRTAAQASTRATGCVMVTHAANSPVNFGAANRVRAGDRPAGEGMRQRAADRQSGLAHALPLPTSAYTLAMPTARAERGP